MQGDRPAAGDPEAVEQVRIANDPGALDCAIHWADAEPEVAIEATSVLGRSTFFRPLGRECIWPIRWVGSGFANRRVKTEWPHPADLANLLRVGRLSQAGIALPAVRQLSHLVRYRGRLVALRSALKA